MDMSDEDSDDSLNDPLYNTDGSDDNNGDYERQMIKMCLVSLLEKKNWRLV